MPADLATAIALVPPLTALLGDRQRLPFAGQVRMQWGVADAAIAIAARVGVDPSRGMGSLTLSAGGDQGSDGAVGRAAAPDPVRNLVTPFRAARALQDSLERGLGRQLGRQDLAAVSDRHGLLRLLWSSLAQVDPEDLGPAAGADLTLLAVACDRQGIGVAGVGLSGLWGRSGGVVTELAPSGHPLLGPPGLPTNTPGVLTLDAFAVGAAALDLVFGAPAPLVMDPGRADDLLLRCGVRT